MPQAFPQPFPPAPRSFWNGRDTKAHLEFLRMHRHIRNARFFHACFIAVP